MSYCLNPDCQKPENSAQSKFCHNCGTKLLLGDRYRSLKLIGQGGFGRTLLSVDEYIPSKQRCVIKQFFPQTQCINNADKASKLFAQEAVRLDEMGKYPQIPELLAYLTQDRRQYLVQEFIDGQNLAQELAESGAFSEQKIRDLLSSILPVLQYIHNCQVIHRDIKPENIIRRISNHQLVLVDFGAAKIATGTALAKTGTVIGSAGYVSPEQAMGKAIFASDIYSLGVTCIYLLTHIEPFELYSVSEGKWVWRDFLRHPVSHNLGKILDKMLENATKRRYQSAKEIIKDLSYLPTKTKIKSVCNASPQIWRCIQTIKAHSGWLEGVRAVAISPDGQIIADGSEDNTIKLWNATTGEEICTLLGHCHFVRAIAFSPNGQTLISGSEDKTIKLWNVHTGQEIRTLLGHIKEVTTIAISPDGQLLASGSEDNTIKLWNVDTGQEIRTFVGHSDYVLSVAFSPDGQKLVSGSHDYTIKVWLVKNGKEIANIMESQWIISVAISPDGKTLVSGNRDGEIKLWNFTTGRQIQAISGHCNRNWFLLGINAIAISPNGKIIASSGDEDKTIKLWDLQQGKLLQTLSGHSKGVTSTVFSSDSHTLISGSYDNTIKIWRCN